MEEVFKALSDPTRLRIVRMLAESGETCVCVLVAELGMGQPAISHHMAVLKRAGLVTPRREGQWIHYSLNSQALENGPVAALMDIVNAAKLSKIKADAQTCCC